MSVKTFDTTSKLQMCYNTTDMQMNQLFFQLFSSYQLKSMQTPVVYQFSRPKYLNEVAS